MGVADTTAQTYLLPSGTSQDKDAFNSVKSGRKTIEMRLLDDKRKNMSIGDKITLISRFNDEKIDVEITNLYTYDNFEQLYKNHDKISLGYNEEDIASPADMNLYYPYESQLKYGVVGIEIKLI